MIIDWILNTFLMTSSPPFLSEYMRSIFRYFLSLSIYHHAPPSTTTHNHPQSLTTIHNLPPVPKIYLPSPTTNQNISTTIRNHQRTAKIYLPSSTTTHRQPKYIHHHPTQSEIYQSKNIKVFNSEVNNEKHFN